MHHRDDLLRFFDSNVDENSNQLRTFDVSGSQLDVRFHRNSKKSSLSIKLLGMDEDKKVKNEKRSWDGAEEFL